MSRIKKQGLDYFPLNTDFMHDRLVRRILKREGDAALAVLLQTLCSIYSGEGYYVQAGRLFYDDLADCLYQQEATDVERILRLAVECGLFDARLFSECGVLTSADIQRQFLFITKRRNSATIDDRYNLLSAGEASGKTPAAPKEAEHNVSQEAKHDVNTEVEGNATKEAACNASEKAEGNAPQEAVDSAETTPENVHRKAQNVTENRDCETFQSENSEKAHFGTQSIAKQSIVKQSTGKQSKENPLLNSSPGSGGTEDADKASAEDEYLRKIATLQLPNDGLKRNPEGLIYSLRQLRISPQEQYAILLKSNFGVIGHPLWKGFYTLRESRGKIRQPGRYLLSLCKPPSR